MCILKRNKLSLHSKCIISETFINLNKCWYQAIQICEGLLYFVARSVCIMQVLTALI